MTQTAKRAKKAKKESRLKLSFSEIFSICASVILFSLLLKSPSLVSASVINSLKQCSAFLIPSLFPLMTVSEIATECGAVDFLCRPLKSTVGKIFGIDKDATSPFFLGLVGGYTTSVNSAVSLYQRGKISKENCERILSFSCLPSLAFLTVFVGSGIFQSPTIGWILWLICIASTIILSFLERVINKMSKRKHPRKYKSEGVNDISFYQNINYEKKSFSKIVVNAISHSAQAMLIICACVVFFATLIFTLQYPLEYIGISREMRLAILGSIELTNGISACQQIENPLLQMELVSFFIGWSGISIHFQIISLCENANLSFKRYFVFKALQGIICAILSLIVFFIM